MAKNMEVFVITVLKILNFCSTHILCELYLVIIEFLKGLLQKVFFQIDLT